MSTPLDVLVPILDEPFRSGESGTDEETPPYEKTLAEARALQERPRIAGGYRNISRQHGKNRMTVWERIGVLSDERPMVLFQNWGPSLDGASLVTAIVKIHGRDVAVYGHDFTVRAGSMDATNGRKLASLYGLAAKQGMPVIGLNDSAGAFVPAGVGGLDGYAEAFTALRRISGIVPSVMCMFGFNAGGGSYLPRQGSFLIQPNDTFFGLTGVGVVKEVLGEDVTPDELGGPGVHGASGVADFTVADEVDALRLAARLLTYLPDDNRSNAPYAATSDPVGRDTENLDVLFRTTFNSPTGFNTPFDIRLVVQEVCDHGEFLEVQPERARSTVTAFGRLGGYVVGFVANNSAFSTGFIDVDAAYKNARFIRFCNLYNIPIVFMEDTTGFLPGTEQESRGVVQAGRAMLDSIVDLRTPRILVLVRNAFGGAYASFNNYATGADFVFALPATRVAVMGPAGREFVYKDELAGLSRERASRFAKLLSERRGAGADEAEARREAEREVSRWFAAEDAKLVARYERDIMNPREALSLGSISQMVLPRDLRRLLADTMDLCMRHYRPSAMTGPQREFH
ncbi:MAG: acetyl-CoA carboxylase carboxyltransferase subunit [Gammaproteobacteria bacterium]|nr:acetyl-CoA carboxylase carboxyltransferase subunit [Gammaproteobacteria bacterium]